MTNPDQSFKPNNLLYINYNDKEIPSLKKFISFEPKDLFGPSFSGHQFSYIGSFLSKSNKISFKLQKKPGKPGKFDIQKSTPKNEGS
jgi:hypothetical protein